MARQSPSSDSPSADRYRAPALEKGLQILEFLADKPKPMSMGEIADALERSKNEIYRMLVILEQKGYLSRADDDRYRMTGKLLDLAMRNPPPRNLTAVALPAMERLAQQLGQSCHLAVRTDDEIIVIARVEAPGKFGFAVRIGYRTHMTMSTSGAVLFAFQPDSARQAMARILQRSSPTPTALATLVAQVETFRAQGYVVEPSAFLNAITDIGAPIMDDTGTTAIASLTVPFVSGPSIPIAITDAAAAIVAATTEISRTLATGDLPQS